MGARADIYFEDLDKKAEYDMTITEIVAELEDIHSIAMDLRHADSLNTQSLIQRLYKKLDTLLVDIEESRVKEDEEHGE